MKTMKEMAELAVSLLTAILMVLWFGYVAAALGVAVAMALVILGLWRVGEWVAEQ